MIFILIILVTMNIDVMYLFWFNDWPNYSEYFRQDIIVKCIALHTKLILCFKAKPILMMIRVECLKRFLYEWWFCIQNKLEKVYCLRWIKRDFFLGYINAKKKKLHSRRKVFLCDSLNSRHCYWRLIQGAHEWTRYFLSCFPKGQSLLIGWHG